MLQSRVLWSDKKEVPQKVDDNTQTRMSAETCHARVASSADQCATTKPP